MSIVDVLNNAQIALFGKIARKTKCDCWFFIDQYERGKQIGKFYVHDLENNKKLSLRTGIGQLMDALDCRENFDHCDLTDKEKRLLGNTIGYMKVKTPEAQRVRRWCAETEVLA